MSEKKVYSVYVRENFAGPWTRVAWFADKRSAAQKAHELKMFHDETKVLTEFAYQVRA